ncbi:MAG: hypothetical protein ICV68_15730 [Pyrinomonadaceae bacterium]|nr:hypothetical protein [Pyrinomonadaceae bacterium]
MDHPPSTYAKSPKLNGIALICGDAVGVAGFEPTTSSSRIMSELSRDQRSRVHVMVRALVCIGVRCRPRRRLTRLSPRFLSDAIEEMQQCVILADGEHVSPYPITLGRV